MDVLNKGVPLSPACLEEERKIYRDQKGESSIITISEDLFIYLFLEYHKGLCTGCDLRTKSHLKALKNVFMAT